MGNNNFTIKYTIVATSKKDVQSVIEKINLILKSDDYHILTSELNSISFDNYHGNFVILRGASSDKVDKGIFEISDADDKTQISLTIFISYKFVLLFTCALIIYSLLSSLFALILVVFLLIALTVEISKQKNNASELLKSAAL